MSFCVISGHSVQVSLRLVKQACAVVHGQMGVQTDRLKLEDSQVCLLGCLFIVYIERQSQITVFIIF